MITLFVIFEESSKGGYVAQVSLINKLTKSDIATQVT